MEQKTHEGMKTKDLLEEKVMEIQVLKQEIQQVIFTVVSLRERERVSVETFYVSEGKGFSNINCIHHPNTDDCYHT